VEKLFSSILGRVLSLEKMVFELTFYWLAEGSFHLAFIKEEHAAEMYELK